MPIAIKINPKDNVVVALHPIAKGNEYTVSDDRWALEFYNEHKNDDIPTLVHAVMTNEQMWGQDLTKVAGFEEATVKNLTMIREQGALAAYKSCL